jgi:hypothetical protein
MTRRPRTYCAKLWLLTSKTEQSGDDLSQTSCQSPRSTWMGSFACGWPRVCVIVAEPFRITLPRLDGVERTTEAYNRSVMRAAPPFGSITFHTVRHAAGFLSCLHQLPGLLLKAFQIKVGMAGSQSSPNARYEIQTEVARLCRRSR